MNGLLDPRSAMILQTGLGLLAGSGPQATPGGFGEAVGKAGLLGMNAYQQAIEGNQRAQLFDLKMAEVQREAEERKQKEAALAALTRDPRFAGMGPLMQVAPKEAITQALGKPDIHADAQGVMRYTSGPNIGRVVPGFDVPKAEAGFKYVDGKLTPIPEYWEQRRLVAEAGKPSTTIENYPNPIPVRGPDGQPQMVQFGKKGEMRATPYQPYEEPKQPTDAERVAAGYAARMQASEQIIQEVGPVGNRTLGTDAAAKIPFVGAYAERKTMTPEQQQVRQAQEDWVRAKLRKESGATIPPAEMNDEINTYFPQPGDSPAVIDQKARSRAIAAQGMAGAAGRAAPKPVETKVVPRSKQFTLDGGGSVIGTLEPQTGKYYVVRGGKKFYIEE